MNGWFNGGSFLVEDSCLVVNRGGFCNGEESSVLIVNGWFNGGRWSAEDSWHIINNKGCCNGEESGVFIVTGVAWRVEAYSPMIWFGNESSQVW